jgi:hypothetical protein
MFNLRMLILLSGILWGVATMSFETQFNQNTREAFKQSIDYPTLVARHPPEKIVLLDWRKSLEKLTDKDGNEWIGVLEEESLGQHGQGEQQATLKSQKGTAIVEITSLSGDWKHRLDYLVWTESLTNRAEVNLKIRPGVDDLYLTPKDSSQITFSVFLYGNFYVYIKSWDAGDIDALAKSIHQIMKKNHRSFGAEHKNCFKVTADKSALSVGEVVSITVEGLVKNWDSEWIFNQSRQLLNDNMEYLERRGNVFLLKAVKKGKIKIPFAAMNKQTLYVEHQEVEIEVK